MTGLEAARTWLFLPGDRLDRLPRAFSSGAEVVVVDLEDAVANTAKDDARAAVVAAASAVGSDRFVVRINAIRTSHAPADLEALFGSGQALPGLLGVMVPKAESVDDVEQIPSAPDGVGIVPLIESARGLMAAAELATLPGVVRLAFGGADFAIDVGADGDETAAYARSQLVVVSRAAGIAAPVDSPCLSLDGHARIASEARRSRAAGMGGKLCVHPAQVPTVARVFAPTKGELEWARTVVAAGGPGAARAGGELVDAPVLERARRLLAQASVSRTTSRGGLSSRNP